MGRVRVMGLASFAVCTLSQVMPWPLASFFTLGSRPKTPMEPVMVVGSAKMRSP